MGYHGFCEELKHQGGILQLQIGIPYSLHQEWSSSRSLLLFLFLPMRHLLFLLKNPFLFYFCQQLLRLVAQLDHQPMKILTLK